jgi:ribosome biogenesis protein MAK21
MSRFEKQMDTIFQVTHSSNFNTSIQALMLIQQISATKHFSTDRFYRTLYESLLDPRLTTSSKHIMYLNLLYRALKGDTSIKRVKAFVKRLLQIIHLHEPPFICGVLYLINELMNTFPSIKSMLTTPEDNASDSEEEHYDDVTENPTTPTKVEKPKRRHYDPRKRDPDHADADLSCLWELLPLQAHYHPSVHVLASKIMSSEPVKEKPDPTIYTLMNFLDKFAFRNAKIKQTTHGTSIMQPLTGSNVINSGSYLITDRAGVKYDEPINSEQFWKKKVDEVRDDEVFFHAYFEKSGKAKQKIKKKEKKRDRDDSEEEEEGEDAIWKALVQSRPEVEGGDDDSDGLDDFDMDDMMSDDKEGEGADAGSDGGVELNLESEDEVEDMADGKEFDDPFDLDDADDIVPSDDDVLVNWDTEEDEEAEAEAESDADAAPKSEKQKKEKKAKKRRKLKHLPTFASADDYAKMLDADDDEDV